MARTALAVLQSWVALAAISAKMGAPAVPTASAAMGAVERLNVLLMLSTVAPLIHR